MLLPFESKRLFLDFGGRLRLNHRWTLLAVIVDVVTKIATIRRFVQRQRYSEPIKVIPQIPNGLGNGLRMHVWDWEHVRVCLSTWFLATTATPALTAAAPTYRKRAAAQYPIVYGRSGRLARQTNTRTSSSCSCNYRSGLAVRTLARNGGSSSRPPLYTNACNSWGFPSTAAT